MKLAVTMYSLNNSYQKGEHERFIIGATKAFPEYNLNALFYVDSEKSQNKGK